jgi:transposase InsO family protein
VEQWILKARDAHPTWGPKKLVPWVRSESGLPEVCAVSTAGEILRRHGLTVPRKVTRKNEPFAGPLAPGTAPNDLWCVDFKGYFRVGDRSRCDPLTMTDACTRYLLKCHALPNTGLAGTRRVFEAAFRQFGLPKRIRSDNGAPFSSLGLGGLSALSLWWIKLGITPERIAPGHPYQNGQHERMHRTLKRETTMPPAATLRAQQRRFDAFRQEFNEQRPHEALGQRRPAEIYRSSPRVYSGRAVSPTYPEGMATRKVQSNGMIYWASQRVFLGEAFAGEHVGFESTEDGVWTLRFGHLAIGVFDERQGEIRPLGRAATSGRG